MKKKSKFFDFTTSLDEGIVWTIDLSQPEIDKGKASRSKIQEKRNLLEIAKSHIANINLAIENSHPFSEEEHEASIKKMAQKLLKMEHIRLSDLSTELGINKKDLKLWLKDENPSEDYMQIMKKWVIKEINALGPQDALDFMERYLKSLSKPKKGKSSNEQAENNNSIEAVVLDTRMSFRSKSEGLSKEDEALFEGKDLQMVEITFNEENIKIKESLLLDSSDPTAVSEPSIQNLCTKILEDYINENKIKPSKELISRALNQMTTQINEQIPLSKNLSKYRETLLGLNLNSTSAHPETIIPIKITIKEMPYDIRDTFDWEVTCGLNDPDEFALTYTKDNGLPLRFANIIAQQIRRQISSHVQKSLGNARELFENKILESLNFEYNTRKANEALKSNISFGLAEVPERMPLRPTFPEKTLFMWNANLADLLENHVEKLKPMHQKIFKTQKQIYQRMLGQGEATQSSKPKDSGKKNKDEKPRSTNLVGIRATNPTRRTNASGPSYLNRLINNPRYDPYLEKDIRPSSLGKKGSQRNT